MPETVLTSDPSCSAWPLPRSLPWVRRGAECRRASLLRKQTRGPMAGGGFSRRAPGGPGRRADPGAESEGHRATQGLQADLASASVPAAA